MRDENRQLVALFPIRTVIQKTGLTARQIRYYEQHELITPTRTSGNQRLFSYNDVERLKEIKSMIEKGINVAGIKEMLNAPESSLPPGEEAEGKKSGEPTDEQLHEMLKQQLFVADRKDQVSLIHGELHRFYNL